MTTASEGPRGRGVPAFGRSGGGRRHTVAASARPRLQRDHIGGRTAVVALALLVSGCSANASSERRVTVFAAASLTKAFTEEAQAFEKAHPGTDVVLSFAGSQSLVAQVQQGAPADVLATADTSTMASITQHYQVFAHNQLAIATAPGNPLGITSLKDLGRSEVKVVVAGPTVPVGKATAKALAHAGVTVHPLSLEDAVTGVIGKVRLGEADAGVAYVTDLGTGVAGIPLPGTTTDLAIGTLTDDGVPFVAFVQSAQGQAILKKYGFG